MNTPIRTNNPPVATVHNTDWYKTDGTSHLNGAHIVREWSLKTPSGMVLGPSNKEAASHLSRLEIFLLMFPPNHLTEIMRLTNYQLQLLNQRETSREEVLKFFGIIVLMTRFEFSARASLWSSTAPSKYIPAVHLGQTGMIRMRFDYLFRCMRFSDQPQVRPVGMSNETHRWKLCDDFVCAFNLHRQETFSPSNFICVDESMSRWYGNGGSWINIGLPCYIAIDRKPDKGCEIQNSACGESGVMLRLKLVKNVGADVQIRLEENEGLIHGCLVLKELVKPWYNSQHIVCADSYFASVSTAEEMGRLGLQFIGVVKTASKRFPVTYLSQLEF